MLIWLSRNAAAIGALSAAASALFAVVLTLVTWWYVRLTRTIAAASRDAQRAYVFVEFAPGFTGLDLCVANDGTRAARDIKVMIDYASRPDVRDALATLTPVRSGLRYLAPSRVFRFSLRMADHDMFREDGENNEIRLTVEYRDEGRVRRESTVINIADMAGVWLSSFAEPTERIATAIENLGRTLKPPSSGIMRQMREQAGKRCRACNEVLRDSAQKCPHCQEWQRGPRIRQGGRVPHI